MPFDEVAHEKACEATFTARDEAWGRFGETDPHVLAPLINPSFQGGPTWPNLRQAYKIVRKGSQTLMASDGLSDPFDDSWDDPPPQNGFAMEVYAIADSLPPGNLAATWLFQVVAGFGVQVANHGHIHTLLEELGTISTELYDIPVPDEHRARFVNEAGRVGVLVGLTSAEVPDAVEGPVSSIRFANLLVLTLPELQVIVERGEAGRAEIANRLLERGDPLVSSFDRVSVV